MTTKKSQSASGSVWTDEKVAELKRLCSLKIYGVSEIGKMLGLTRGAVSGKIDRLGILNKTKEQASNDLKKIRPLPDGTTVEAWFIANTPKLKNTKPWIERVYGECAFPFTVDGDIHSCCAPCDADHGQNYCDEHRGVMRGSWRPAKPRHPQLKTDGRFA